MDTDQPTPDINPDQQVTSPDEQQVFGQARSYGCTFCKRGFSNAQALGGHMNIHRKDKAKLKQSSSSSHDHQPSHNMFSTQPLMEPTKSITDQERSINLWTWVLGEEPKRENAHVGEVRQLSLFAEKPLSQDYQNLSSEVHAEKGLSGSELDLELRLGPEPQDSSSSPGTKGFF